MTDLSYVLPLRWEEDEGIDELAGYLQEVSEIAEVVVVDGSTPAMFDRLDERLGSPIRHLPPHEDLAFVMGKVNGVTTGVREATNDYVVVADDDVRYSPSALRRVRSLLDDHELVRPQNYFDPVPWHALWDTARTLLNRSVSVDYPGTLGLRRDFFLAMGGYDGNVMFENLELIRTVQAHRGRVASPLDLYVRRIPPTTDRFVSQRVRQAYDDFAIPGRMALWLALPPATALSLARNRGGRVAAGAAVAMAVAEVGRRRAGGTSYFPATAPLFAPAWLLERGVCSWLALGSFALHGGVRYGGGIIRRAASSKRRLRKLAASRTSAR
ncbi:MAG TPA: glycosyltransferase [Actinomycetota bacterium]|nr:glycosyltransferase [Actinomycetota bacterium]